MAHIVCSYCSATNRIGDGHDARGAKCGRCGKMLFDGHAVDIATTVLEKHIAKSDIPVLVDVWAPWCGPCRVTGPEFEAAAGRGEPAMRFVKLNSDDNQEMATRLGIRGIPTMIMFREGREVARTSGAMSSTEILRWASRQT